MGNSFGGGGGGGGGGLAALVTGLASMGNGGGGGGGTSVFEVFAAVVIACILGGVISAVFSGIRVSDDTKFPYVFFPLG